MFGIHFPGHRPLSPVLNPRELPPLGSVGATPPYAGPPAILASSQSPLAPAAPAGALTSLPTPPAEVKRKRLNPFDKEHLSQSLMAISKGFAGGNGFFGGIAAGFQGIGDNLAAERKAMKGSDEIGGPDNAFRIHTDADGTQTFTPIEEVQDYLDGKTKRANAPKPADTANYIGDTLYAVEQLPIEQRPDAYRLMRQQAADQGHNLAGVPEEYSPTFSKAMIARTIGARQGSANAATAADRAERNADRDASREASIGFRERSNARADQAAGRSAESHRRSMRKAPPSTRRGTNDLDYLK